MLWQFGIRFGYSDVSLMNMRIPETAGLEATAWFRTMDHPDAKAIPMIVLL